MRGAAPTGRETAGEETGEEKNKKKKTTTTTTEEKGMEREEKRNGPSGRNGGKQGSRGIEAAEGGHVVELLSFFVVFWRRVSGGRGYGRVQGDRVFFFWFFFFY